MAKNSGKGMDARKQAEAEALAAEFGWANAETIESGKNLKFDVGTVVNGRIAALPYKAGKSHAFDIEVSGENGSEVVSYWVPTILLNLLKRCKDGDMVAIKCTEIVATPNGDAYDFVVIRR